MAKSATGVHENGNHEAETDTPTAVDVTSGNVSSSKQLGRPKKKSRQGKGGGPKTAAGKAKVSRNAIKHGIMSKSPVIPGMEEEEEWQAHRAAAVESLEPDGHLETVLAERIAFLFCRFLRVVRYETAVTAAGVEFQGVGTPDAEMRMLPTNSHLDRIMRYDGNIQRQLVQTYNLFEAVQARRKGQPVNHTRIDIGSSPQFRNTRAPALSDAFANLN